MISFLSSPKAFSGHASLQQITAIQSWLAIDPEVEVILYGNSAGIEAACEKLGICHVPDIESTTKGIPYFGAITAHASKHARYDIQVYLNCDILLTPEILAAIQFIKFPAFLMIGQRIDLAEGIEINFNKSDIINQLCSLATTNSISLHTPGGSDYFAFRRGMWNDLPPVVIGRGGYDNALIAYCLQRNIPVVDATLAVLAVHQFHDYSHANGGVKEVFDGEDANNNLAFVPQDAIPVLEDANYKIRDQKILPSYGRGDRLRYYFMKYRYKNEFLLSKVFRILWLIQLRLKLRNHWEPTLQEVLAANNKQAINNKYEDRAHQAAISPKRRKKEWSANRRSGCF